MNSLENWAAFAHIQRITRNVKVFNLNTNPCPARKLTSRPYKTVMTAALKLFIWISRLEAISYLLLLGIAMPLKYALDMPLMVKYLGWAHGILFMAYMIQLLWIAYQLKWDVLRIIHGFIAAMLPFGPFVFERSLKKDYPNPA